MPWVVTALLAAVVAVLAAKYWHSILLFASVWMSGIASVVGLYLYLCYRRVGSAAAAGSSTPWSLKSPRHYKKYAFSSTADNWSKELVNLAKDQKIASPIFGNSIVLSDSIEVLVEGIVNQFVLSWYGRFSSDKVFPSTLDQTMRQVVAEVGSRAQNRDWADFLVRTLTPLVSDHIKRYVQANKSVQSVMTNSAELPIAVAEAYGNLHPAIANKKYLYETARKDWLRGKVRKVLPFLLASSKSELHSPIVFTLLTEITSCSVLLPVLSTLSDADFWNQTVVKLGADTLRDQSKVHKFRKALEAHISSDTTSMSSLTSSSLEPRKSSHLRRHSRKLSKSIINLSPYADESEYDRFLRRIKDCSNLADARQARYNISVQLKRIEKAHSGSLYQQRLLQGKHLIERQIELLTGTQYHDGPETPAYDSLDPRELYTLTEVLNDSSCCQLFMDFMDQKRKTILLEFWLTVNTLDRNEDPLGGIEIDTHADNANAKPAFLDMPDINEMYRRYLLNNLFVRLVSVDQESIDTVAEFTNASPSPSAEQHAKARKVLFALQDRVFSLMRDRELPHFKSSDMFLKYLATSAPSIHKKTPSGNIDQLQLVGEDDQEADVVQAVQEAFEDIMGESTSKDKRLRTKVKDKSERFMEKISSTTDKLKRIGGSSPRESLDEARSSSSLEVEETLPSFRQRSLSKVSQLLSRSEPDLTNTAPAPARPPSPTKELALSSPSLNGDGSENESDEQDNNNKENSAIEIHTAAPSNLGLTETISNLSEDIDRLYQQKDVVEFMLRKAELVNNRQDMRILEKSSSSLQREIQFKELQRQQYIVQESDNSLYGKSDIQIQSYMYANDKYGAGYVLYFVEVSRFDEDGNLSAGWIVARRYSQFLELHQHLRETFAQVRLLEFPKKRMLIKFQNRGQVDNRRIALERYLKELLKLPEVCQHKEFRYFLSSESLHGKSGESAFVSSGNSGPSSPSVVSAITGALSPAASGLFSGLTGGGGSGLITSQSSIDYEESSPALLATASSSSSKGTFVQPICDLFTQVFGLDSGDYSLRGRAIVVILSQLLGGTVEKRVREFVNKQLSARVLTDRVQTLRDVLWPNGEDGEFRQRVVRTSAQKSQCKHEASDMIKQLIGNMTSKVVGLSSSRYASNVIFAMYQNEILNAHLVYSIFDELILFLFPELVE